MKKTQVIKQIIDEKLKDYGFAYQKTEGFCRIFIREAQGIKRYYDPENEVVRQYVSIQESSFPDRCLYVFTQMRLDMV